MASGDWERHKATILNLYLIEKAPLHQVISSMQEKHNFAKKKSQYEYQFKKWGVKKNLKKEDWQRLHRQLQKRVGKQSEVTSFGVPLSTGRIRKETRRYAAIPTAKEFGKRLPSPGPLEGTVIRAQTPPLTEAVAWPPLPWFDFKNRTLPLLRNPSGLLDALFTTLGHGESFPQHEGKGGLLSLFEISRNPVELREAIFHLAKTIPDDSVGRDRKAKALAQNQLSLSIATEMLKLVFFTLSNNFIPYHNEMDLRAHDKFVLHLVEAVSRSNPDMLSSIFSDHCVTADTIKHAVYGSAIREKNYSIVSRLIESGVSPNTPVRQARYNRTCRIERGLTILGWGADTVRWSGIHEAALSCDIRLCKILLDAGASVESDCTENTSTLAIAAFAGNFDESVEFARLLVKHGALTEKSASCYRCWRLKLIKPIFISIAKANDRMVDFLIDQDLRMPPYKYSEALRLGCDKKEWSSNLTSIGILQHTPLHVAIMSGNRIMIERLLLPVLSRSRQIFEIVLKDALIISTLAGDADTTSIILAHCPDIAAIEKWERGITPLVATAWNRDVTAANLLLGLNAHVGPRLEDRVLRTSTPAPIHVAAYHGNQSLVRLLLARGADCNVFHTPLSTEEHFGDSLDCLLPQDVANPLQLALLSGCGEVAKLLISQMQAVNLGDGVLGFDPVFGDAGILSANQTIGTIIEDIVEIGHAISIIQSYFSLGGLYQSQDLYRAVLAAIECKDYSIVRLLAHHRPTGEIDSHEASSLIISIKEGAWDLVSLLLRDPFLPGPSQSYYRITHTGLEYRRSTELDYNHFTLINRSYPECSGRGLTPLGWAIYSVIQSIVEEMLRWGYKLHDKDMEVLLRDGANDGCAATSGLFPLESMGLSRRQALLVYSIQLCDMQKVHRCIKLVHSLDFNFSADNDFYTHDDIINLHGSPLTLAAGCGNVELINLLLNAGASIDFQSDKNHQTALVTAALEGHLDVVNSLLDRGAMVQSLGLLKRETTAMQYSAIKGDLKIAKLLISKGADINALPAKSYGRTALEGAAENGRLDMVQFLLVMGAKLEGEMRIYYVRSVGFARRQGHYAVAELLQQYGLWDKSDEVLSTHLHTHYVGPGYFRYDEEIGDWHLRKMEGREGDDDYHSVGSENSSESSSYEAHSSGSESGEADSIEDDNDRPRDNSYNTDCVPEAGLEGIDLAVAGFDSHTFTSEPAVHFGLTSYQVPASQKVIQLDEVPENFRATNVAGGAEHAMIDYHTQYRPETYEQESMIREGELHFETNRHIPGMGFNKEGSVPLDTIETEWEGPFSSFGEIDNINEAFGVLPLCPLPEC